MGWFRVRQSQGSFWFCATAVGIGLIGFSSFPQTAFHDFLSTTHCYQSVRTHSKATSYVNCFSVTPSGTFSKVFQAADGSSLAARAQPGFVIPGLWEYATLYSLFLLLEDVRGRLESYLSDHPNAGTRKEWLRGLGWDQMALGQMPTAADLAASHQLKDRYIMLDRVDMHCIWVSEAILNLLPESIPDVSGGDIVRYPGMGVFCDNAMKIIMDLRPEPDAAKKETFLRSAMTSLHKVGLVGVHDAGVNPGNLALYRDLVRSSDWTLRVYAMVECYERNAFCGNEIEKYVDERGFLDISSVKLFADGALGSWGSALIKPYSDRPDTSGSLLINSSELTKIASAWATKGFQVNIHAIGDLANRNAINAIEAALQLTCREPSLAMCQARRRFRIEHCQIVHPDDQVRMRSIGVIPSIQPTHATSDMAYVVERLGRGRTTEEAYRMRSLLETGPVLGSDFPIEPCDPFQGIYAAVTRRNPHTGQGTDDFPEGWYAEEALSLDQAVRGFSEGPAYGSFMEGRAGVIQRGAFADWVVLDKPLEEMDIEDFRSVNIRETWVAGKRVYERN
ncbi:hypothetical protein PG999_003914 [Apiospora kogelbergensis]|uniref:Amidohydrolase 3 domain-containing protein n=1 Tax=Apiospora kogelbergensis TaxID=1337665 RepID=A0AAW0R518_9PEZI